MPREPPPASGLALISGLSEIADDYDSLVCDVWGVLHNGREAFAAASATCGRFREAGRPVVLVSNAPRLSSQVQAQLDRLGVPRSAYDAIVTSGETTRAELVRRTKEQALRIFHIGPERDRGVYEGLNVRIVGEGEAELVLATGLNDDEREGPDDYRTLLNGFMTRDLPLICANPDVVVQRGTRLIYCAGAIARLYEEMGGQALYFGKPHSPIYAAVRESLAAHGAAQRPLVTGDGIDTDIKGANGAGIDALFVIEGIHAGEIADKSDAAAIGRLLNSKGVWARWATDTLKW